MFVKLLEFKKSSFSIFPVLKELNKLLNPPVAGKSNSEDTNKIVKLPWIPRIGRQLKKTFKKKNYTSSGLKLLLCQSKTKLLPNSYLGA